MDLEKKKPADWLLSDDFRGIVVVDPDGWRHRDDGVTWETPLTMTEFSGRLMFCTLDMRKWEYPLGLPSLRGTNCRLLVNNGNG